MEFIDIVSITMEIWPGLECLHSHTAVTDTYLAQISAWTILPIGDSPKR